MNENAQPDPGPALEPAGPDLGAEFDALATEAGPDAGPGEYPAPVESDLPTKQAVAFFLSPLFAVVFPNWRIGADEVDALADVYAPVIDKYLPGGMGVEGAALLVTVAVFGPRLAIPRKAPAPDAAPAAVGVPLPETAPAPAA
jgi:hypothetical protein